MDVQALAANFAAFMTKHSGELRLVGSTLETVITHLPIDQQDKTRLLDATTALQTAAGNIAKGAEALSGATVEVVVAKEDVVEAVREVVSETERAIDPSHGQLAAEGQGATGNASLQGDANGA